MVHQRHLQLFIAGLLTLLAILPVKAAEREKTTIPLDEHVTLPAALCGFPIVRERTGFVQITTVYDDRGNVVEVITKEHSHGSFSANGQSLSFVQAATWIDAYVPSADGSYTSIRHGLSGIVTLPGEGNIGANVGTLIIRFPADDGAPIVEHEAGQSTRPFPSLCAYLAP